MEESQEPSILEYARFYGLVRDHLMVHPLQSSCLLDSSVDPSAALKDPEGPVHLAALPPYIVHEKLSASKDAAVFLSYIRQSSLEEEGEKAAPLDYNRVKNMKMELPVLRTDNELDIREFAPRAIPHLARLNIPLEKVDVEKDEGLAWPSSVYSLPEEFNSMSIKEKLDAPKDALVYLQAVLRTLPKEDDELLATETYWAPKVGLNLCCERSRLIVSG